MDLKDISPDQAVFWQWGPVEINATIIFTWAVILILVLLSWIATRKVESRLIPTRWQNMLEVVVGTMRNQIRDISRKEPNVYLPFVGSLFLYIFTCNVLAVVPGFTPPTASLSTTAALALAVFVAVPFFGIQSRGLKGYLSQYLKPTLLMLPFNILGELSRTLALAVRLFGNIMSGAKIAAVLLAIVPLVFPVVMQTLGLLTGVIQAYIFAVLAMVYIASAVQARQDQDEQAQTDNSKGDTAHG